MAVEHSSYDNRVLWSPSRPQLAAFTDGDFTELYRPAAFSCASVDDQSQYFLKTAAAHFSALGEVVVGGQQAPIQCAADQQLAFSTFRRAVASPKTATGKSVDRIFDDGRAPPVRPPRRPKVTRAAPVDPSSGGGSDDDDRSLTKSALLGREPASSSASSGGGDYSDASLYDDSATVSSCSSGSSTTEFTSSGSSGCSSSSGYLVVVASDSSGGTVCRSSGSDFASEWRWLPPRSGPDQEVLPVEQSRGWPRRTEAPAWCGASADPWNWGAHPSQVPAPGRAKKLNRHSFHDEFPSTRIGGHVGSLGAPISGGMPPPKPTSASKGSQSTRWYTLMNELLRLRCLAQCGFLLTHMEQWLLDIYVVALDDEASDECPCQLEEKVVDARNSSLILGFRFVSLSLHVMNLAELRY
ncbi:hypothetical protein ACFE04_019828 [Oxalis oulophora]